MSDHVADKEKFNENDKITLITEVSVELFHILFPHLLNFLYSMLVICIFFNAWLQVETIVECRVGNCELAKINIAILLGPLATIVGLYALKQIESFLVRNDLRIGETKILKRVILIWVFSSVLTEITLILFRTLEINKFVIEILVLTYLIVSLLTWVLFIMVYYLVKEELKIQTVDEILPVSLQLFLSFMISMIISGVIFWFLDPKDMLIQTQLLLLFLVPIILYFQYFFETEIDPLVNSIRTQILKENLEHQ